MAEYSRYDEEGVLGRGVAAFVPELDAGFGEFEGVG